MKHLNLILLGLFAFTAIAYYPYAEEDHIINLGSPTFNTAVAEFPAGLLVYFYEPLCSPCRKMWPEFIEAARLATESRSAIRFAKVECHDEVKLCDERGVKVFPTLQLFRVNRPLFEYRGPRIGTEMVNWIEKVVDLRIPRTPLPKELFSEFQAALVIKDAANNAKEAYRDLFDDVAIFVADEEWLKKIDGGSQAIVAVQSGQIHQVAGNLDANQVKDRVKGLFNEKLILPNFHNNFGNWVENNDNGAYLWFFRTSSFDPKGSEAAAFDKAAQKAFQAGLLVGYVNFETDFLGKTMGKLFGVQKDGKVKVGILNKEKRIYRKYLLEKEISQENIEQFVADFKSEKAKRYYMSSEAGTKYKYITNLVGSNFHQALSDPKLNVFVLFFQPWCEDSIKLMPTWESLAYRTRNIDNVLIARVDLSENDIEGFEIVNFPTLLYFPAGSANYEDYKGDKNIKALKEFLFKKLPELTSSYDL